jgi:molecular chaperone GrpE
MGNETKQEEIGIESEAIQAEEIKIETVEETIASFTQEDIENAKKESEDKYLRLLAEFDNYRKRISKEKEDLRINTKTQMLGAILDIDSDLAIAKKNIKEDEGVNLILNKLESFLKSQGVEKIQTETYDSDLHEVISVLEIGEEKIIDVISKGYTIGGKPFRYPKIILGK